VSLSPLAIRPKQNIAPPQHNTNVSPHRSALQAAQHDLERQKITDNLKKGLEHRPHRESLIERNILPDSTAAPALQAHQRELEKHMRADSLEKQLQGRPKPEDLVKKGILEGESEH
jgi:RPEL repeat